jgi:hypothetical protein
MQEILDAAPRDNARVACLRVFDFPKIGLDRQVIVNGMLIAAAKS